MKYTDFEGMTDGRGTRYERIQMK